MGRLSFHSSWWLLVPSLLLLAAALVVPFGVLLANSLSPNVLLRFNAPALDNFGYILGTAVYRNAAWRTLSIAAIVTLASLAVGFPTAYVLAQLGRRSTAMLVGGLVFPILLGPLVVGVGWLLLLSPTGPPAAFLSQLNGGRRVQLLGTDLATEIATLQYTLPFAVLVMFSSLTRIDVALSEAARDLGASRWQVVWRIVWPLSRPGVVAAALFSFSLAATGYVAPHYLGGDARPTLATLVVQYVFGTFNAPLGATVGLIQLAVVLPVLALVSRVLPRAETRPGG